MALAFSNQSKSSIRVLADKDRIRNHTKYYPLFLLLLYSFSSFAFIFLVTQHLTPFKII